MRFIALFLTQLLMQAVSAQVAGVIRDASGSTPISGAQVFVNRTTVATLTDEKGEFSLAGIAPGFVDFIVYKNGYQIFKSPMRIQEGKSSRLNLKLIPLETTQTPSLAKVKDIDGFKAELLGTSSLAIKCKITNPQSIMSPTDTPDKISLKDPLVIDNQALGYRVTYYLNPGAIERSLLLQKVIVRFDTLMAKNPSQLKEWAKAREDQFFGSRQHFFWSLFNNRATEQGYLISDRNGKGKSADSLVGQSKLPGYRKANFPGKWELSFLQSGSEARISTIESSEPFDINTLGIPLNEQSIEISGAMESSMAEWLPTDYFPAVRMHEDDQAREALRLLQEKIYIQTDKPYYYAGEPLWFKGYVNYFVPGFRDSLSRVMHVELITPDQEVMLMRMLKINGGVTNGDFILPDTLKPGNYYLRAYTNLMRNFGDDRLFIKAIPVVGITDKVDPSQRMDNAVCTGKLSLNTDKPKYKVRERIAVSVNVLDNGMPLTCNLALAVTDYFSVAIQGSQIINDFDFDSSRRPIVPRTLKYPIESGIGFAGQFYNDKGKKEKTELAIVQGKFENVIMRETDEQGYFWETGYDSYDSMDFSIQGKNPKGKPYGRVELSKPQIPPMEFTPESHPLKVIKTNAPQRVVSDYEVPPEARLLKEVTIGAKKLYTSDYVAKSYGAPTRIISGSRLFGTDLLSSLLSTIPGLKITYSPANGIMETRTLTLGHQVKQGSLTQSEPLIYVNDVLRGGGNNVVLNLGGPGAVGVLELINPITVDHVEVIDRPSARIKVEGGVGLIAIYTKPGMGEKKSFEHIKIPGYNVARVFTSPDYADPTTNKAMKDQRATLYWNPDVRTTGSMGEATVSFFAADVPGKYRIVVEGVTEDLEPVRCEVLVEVVE